jgi:uncharacterized protein (UPF0332 family)
MSVVATEFLDRAKAMMAGETEIDLRNAISRSYYAAYHCGIRFADQHCPDTQAHLMMGDHTRLSERFKNCNAIPNGRNLSYMLIAMKRARHKADYELEVELHRSEAETHLFTVDRFLNDLKSLAETASDEAVG